MNLLAEDTLIEIVRKYIAIREQVGPKKPTTAEEATVPELWALLNEDERENRRVAFQEQLDKELLAETEAQEKDAELYFAKDPTDKI